MPAPRSPGKATGARSAVLWLGTAVVCLQQAVTGLWALLWPAHFFEYVPTVNIIRGYNEHLVRDVGAALLATIPVLAVALWRRDSALAALGLLSVLVFTLPHVAFHLSHGSRGSGGSGGSGGSESVLDVAMVANFLVLVGLAFLAVRVSRSARKTERSTP